MSNSIIWKNRKEELDQKEQILLEKINLKNPKTKKIVFWSLGSGMLALIGYMVYRAFTVEEKEKRKKKYVPSAWPIVNSAIENVGSTLGKWLLKQLKN